jgi:hypothetical protein
MFLKVNKFYFGKCPIEVELRKLWKYVVVDGRISVSTNGRVWKQFQHTPETEKCVEDFDAGKRVKPFEVNLELCTIQKWPGCF